MIINLVEDGQPKKYTFVIENFAGNLFRRLEQCQDSVILGKTVFVEAMERGQPLPQDSFLILSDICDENLQCPHTQGKVVVFSSRMKCLNSRKQPDKTLISDNCGTKIT